VAERVAEPHHVHVLQPATSNLQLVFL
jgi:hypothetical protein